MACDTCFVMNRKVFDTRGTVLACAVLAVATLAVFGQVRKNDFIYLDDPDYVTENEYVQKGLSEGSIVWAFTSFHASNWHPLTWLSLMLDQELFGLRAGGFHLTNLLLHTANALLLFLVLRKMSGSLYPGFFVALVFAFHPLHVESVAWVAERKDVLSTLFWLLTMWAYAGYAQQGGTVRYLVTTSVFALGLMAKPMLVTLPCVLLLLDYWPLERLVLSGGRSDGATRPAKRRQRPAHRPTPAQLILEKVPLFILSAASIVVTVIAQRSGGAVISIKALPYGWRISNAIVSYAVYILKMFVPIRLAAFYPNMSPPSLIETVGAAVLLGCITFGVILGAKRYKYLVTGWLWYLVTLAPVVGIVQVGAQAYADRYTYVPLTGLFVIIAWLIADVLAGWRYRTIAVTLSLCLVAVSLAIGTTLQLRHWRDTVTLFEHTVAVTEDNCVAHNALANAYGRVGQIDKCIEHGSEALRIFPEYDSAHYNLAMGYYSKGDLRKAIEHWQQALRLKRDFREANFNIGVAFEALGQSQRAVDYFNCELQINPTHQLARRKREALLAKYPHLRSGR